MQRLGAGNKELFPAPFDLQPHEEAADFMRRMRRWTPVKNEEGGSSEILRNPVGVGTSLDPNSQENQLAIRRE
jgi:hypothetical protein